MLVRNRNLLLCLGASVLGGLVACGDSATTSSSSSGGTEDGGSTSSSSTSSTSSTSSSSGGDSGTDAAVATPGITVSAPSKTQTSEDGDKITFTVVLKSKPTADVTIALTSDKIGEGTVDKASLTFTAANFATPQTVTVTGVDDDADDGDQDYKVSMAVTSTDAGYKAITPAPVALKNVDNDTASIVVGAPLPNKNTTEKGGKVTFTVHLSSKPTADVTVPVLSDTVAEGTADKATLTFTAADYKVDQTVTVTGIDEVAPDGNKDYMVKLGKATSADAKYKDLEAKVDLTNVDDDMPVQIVGNWGANCVRFVDGNVKCWGRNDAGALGLGDSNHRGDQAGEMGAALPFVNLGTGRTAKVLSNNHRAENHFCAILDDNSLKCWGRNDWGNLGLGDTNARGDQAGEMGDALPAINLGAGRTAKHVESEYATTCALLDNNTVKCWGFAGYGLLGQGNGNQIGDQAGEMGDALPAIDFGAGRTVKMISMGGEHHACAILDNDKVKCWGRNNTGQLGNGTTMDRGNAAGQMGDNLPYADLGAGRTAKFISAGLRHTCAILDNDAVKCWGDGSWGNLGQGNNTTLSAANQLGDNILPINFGAGRSVTALYAGWASNCVILDNKALKCWGYNAEGELGLGDTNWRGDVAGEMGDALPAVDLGAGRNAVSVTNATHSRCAILDNGTVKCWGHNQWGQLGSGNTTWRAQIANQMGDNNPAVVLK